ncbi:succinylglutamate desuccinylase/aspartoacylase family protein [Saliphagus sp. LR7]|uniref:succinylglutamate desuccinylase/aspartoacylase family protein n=1 Tax=Saliphagus sp. LR7 TaxID=2282654 RepID=UPI000DF73A28|nr:succinylglutamate desuccinylase/aspartoacylase family protein [Saliphagus sp. LR7]
MSSETTDRKLFDTADAQITENEDAIDTLEETQTEQGEQIAQLRSALEDRGPIETSGPTIELSPEECDDFGAKVLEHQDPHFRLEKGDYPIKTPIDLHGNADWSELRIDAPPGTRFVVASEDLDYVLRVGGTQSRHQTFDRLSLRNLALVVDPEQGYDAGWGRWWVNDHVRTENLSVEGRRDYYDDGRGLEDGDDRDSTRGDKFGFYSCMTSEGGVGVHRHLNLTDGDTPAGNVDHTQFDHGIGVGSETQHVGTNFWVGCSVEEWWDNGFYLKDGPGSHILLGCEGHNCGGTAIRIGENDVAIACNADWDLPLSADMLEEDYYQESPRYPDTPDDYDGLYQDEVPNGICFGADAALATVVRGLDVHKETGQNEAVRLWSDESHQITLEDVYVRNKTSQYGLALRGEGRATAKGDNVRVIDTGDTSAKGAAVQVDRWNVVLEDSVIDASGGGGDRDAIDVQSGRVDVRGGSLAGAEGYCIRVQDGADRLSIDGTQLLDGIVLYDGSSVGALQLLDADLRKVETMWPGADPRDVVDELVIRDPLGDVDEHPPIQASGNSGNSGVSSSGSGRACEWIEAEGTETPVFEIEGEASGPTIALIGGVHGDEDPGWRIAGRLANMRPQAGTLRIIPRANPEAIADRSRTAGYDLNRVWPRSSEPSTELARAIWEHVQDADVVIDLHRSTGIYPDGAGQAIYSSSGGESKGATAVKEFNARYVDPSRFGGEYKFSHVPGQSDGTGIASMIRFCASDGMDAHLIETTTKGVAMERPVEWLFAITNELLHQYGVYVE